MREIKFRAWDTRENKMLLPEFQNYWLQIGLEGIIYEYSNGRLSDTTIKPIKNSYREYPYILMQYTGLKDKNGKEIYEGDIVQEDIRRDKRSKPIMRWSVVVYSEKGMFIVECLPKSLRQWNELYKENDEVEVIGNIYENPELLNPHTT